MNAFSIMSLLLTVAAATTAPADPNFLTPKDLPVKAEQVYGASGRGQMPDFPQDYGIDLALKADHAHDTCMAPVGAQLSPWNSVRKTGIYWSYTISAMFECLSPKVETRETGALSAQLYADLKGLTEKFANGSTLKSADVNCYERLEDVCEGTVLQTLNERETCELSDQNQGGALTVIDDLTQGPEVLQDQGARALAHDLPVYDDGRRDDTPVGNCKPHVYGQLKGISRKTAHILCAKDQTGLVDCVIRGIIKD